MRCTRIAFAPVEFLSASFNRQPPKPKMKMTLKRALGFTALVLLLPCVLLGLLVGCATHPSTAARLQRLQGTWEGVLVGQEKDGKITITITGNSLRFHRDTNFWFETTFTLPAGTDPQQLRTTITGGPDKDSIGKMVPAIFKTGDGNLTLAVNQDNGHAPPKSFDDDTPGHDGLGGEGSQRLCFD